MSCGLPTPPSPGAIHKEYLARDVMGPADPPAWDYVKVKRVRN